MFLFGICWQRSSSPRKSGRRDIGGASSFRSALVVAGLPKTRSGRILRGTMRKIADGEDYPLPATIDDPAILAEIGAILSRAGYAGREAG